jgi:AraC family transcriptional regulator of adaptative response/methylated-DNA-[protein]-cysteine methyltransferase
MAFADNRENAFNRLQAQFPNAHYTQMVDNAQQQALFIFKTDWSQLSNIKLHLKGTNFQLKVWEALLNIPLGGLATYSSVAKAIDHPAASRAVGGAVGDNPVAFLIPCHRVIRSTGETGEYHWGAARKSAIIGWEAARVDGLVE